VGWPVAAVLLPGSWPVAVVNDAAGVVVSGDRPGWDDAAMIERVELELMHLRDEDGGTPTFWELAEAAYGVIVGAVRADERTRIADSIAERCEEVYPPDVFTPVTPEDVRAYHAGFSAAGLSVDQWSAHIMRHAHRIIAAEVREGGRSPCS
jgi:hypothetical protein